MDRFKIGIIVFTVVIIGGVLTIALVKQPPAFNGIARDRKLILRDQQKVEIHYGLRQ